MTELPESSQPAGTGLLPAWRFSVAPMMELTDRHYRYLARSLCGRALLFTEMVTAKAVIHGDQDYLLGFNREEHPLALQLGGADPQELTQAAQLGESFGYDEINLNVGCPSDRVQSGRFGACLMAEPELVADCIAAMQAAVSLPVTVKCRVGIDRDDSYDLFESFIRVVAERSGCKRFYVHARKAWLDGLSPKQNRDVPPLRYDFVYRIKQEHPDLQICINGGIDSLVSVDEHLEHVDGVMLGRAAYNNLDLLLKVDDHLFGEPIAAAGKPCGGTDSTDFDLKVSAARNYANYMQKQIDKNVPLTAMSRHLIALFREQPGARQWRRTLSSINRSHTDAIELVEYALAPVVDYVVNNKYAASSVPAGNTLSGNVAVDRLSGTRPVTR